MGDLRAVDLLITSEWARMWMEIGCDCDGCDVSAVLDVSTFSHIDSSISTGFLGAISYR